MNFNEKDLLREKTELLYLRISKLARAKVLLKLEYDTEDQVLFLSMLCGVPTPIGFPIKKVCEVSLPSSIHFFCAMYTIVVLCLCHTPIFPGF